MPQPTRTPEQIQHDRHAEFVAARNVYLVIIGSFVTVCTLAVIFTTRMEASKHGFQAIHTRTPLWGIDHTYMNDHR